MNPCISVIIPIFNSSAYINQCAESLLGQTFRNVEFIFVDDGSEDESAEIIEEYKKHDERVSLFRQFRSGAGAARNKGLSHASGEYVIFVDSDDFFDINMLRDSYKAAIDNNADIVCFRHKCYDNKTGETYLPKSNYEGKSGMIPDQSRGDFMLKLFGVPWNKLVKRSFIEENNLRYQNISCNNDEYFNKMLLLLSHKIYFLDSFLVYYRVNNELSIQGNKAKDLTCFVSVLIEMKNKIRNDNITDSISVNAFLSLANSIQFRVLTLNQDTATLKRSYETVRNHLIPDIFDSVSQFADNKTLMNVYNSDSFEDYLRLELLCCKKCSYNTNINYISKDSATYKLGHFLLYIPSKIKTLFTKNSK